MVRSRQRERGSTIVEGAVTLMLFLMLVFGIIGMGWAVYVYNQVSELAREGTRYAIVHGAGAGNLNPPAPASATDVQNYVLARASGLNPKDLTVTTTWTPNKNPGSVVKVHVQYSLTPIMPLIPQEVLTLQSTSQMVISQ
jgi:Flp pilus assembly protein TadG